MYKKADFYLVLLNTFLIGKNESGNRFILWKLWQYFQILCRDSNERWMCGKEIKRKSFYNLQVEKVLKEITLRYLKGKKIPFCQVNLLMGYPDAGHSIRIWWPSTAFTDGTLLIKGGPETSKGYSSCPNKHLVSKETSALVFCYLG